MFKKQTIFGCEAHGDFESAYLTRIYLLQTRWGDLCLHWFHRSDGSDRHDHPWPFISIILWQGYIEETNVWISDVAMINGQPCPAGRWEVRRKRKWPGMILIRPATWEHRVELINNRPALTLVWKGRRVREWGFFTTQGWQPWKAYFLEKKCRKPR